MIILAKIPQNLTINYKKKENSVDIADKAVTVIIVNKLKIVVVIVMEVNKATEIVNLMKQMLQTNTVNLQIMNFYKKLKQNYIIKKVYLKIKKLAQHK